MSKRTRKPAQDHDASLHGSILMKMAQGAPLTTIEKKAYHMGLQDTINLICDWTRRKVSGKGARQSPAGTEVIVQYGDWSASMPSVGIKCKFRCSKCGATHRFTLSANVGETISGVAVCPKCEPLKGKDFGFGQFVFRGADTRHARLEIFPDREAK